eukprot:CAMPEP_0177636828 /NCGR_PEP_ID=MMETSP0447-20121125/4644_1 /TAXON_ID=0 /ORGANISM="Stygamoeba regulata, Strain BSH-02190019" /LENGTH=143 /DNA_ID=CAMNT_0019138711 /DNA_START=59 /DNA_END=490 /DNA_ORIENTATION=-
MMGLAAGAGGRPMPFPLAVADTGTLAVINSLAKFQGCLKDAGQKLVVMLVIQGCDYKHRPMTDDFVDLSEENFLEEVMFFLLEYGVANDVKKHERINTMPALVFYFNSHKVGISKGIKLKPDMRKRIDKFLAQKADGKFNKYK